MRNAMNNDYSASGLAHIMGMSISSLQRRLQARGLSASKLLDEARYVNAMGMLANRNISIDEIAWQLGFESERGFRKAFKRWTGESPAKARRQMLTA